MYQKHASQGVADYWDPNVFIFVFPEYQESICINVLQLDHFYDSKPPVLIL